MNKVIVIIILINLLMGCTEKNNSSLILEKTKTKKSCIIEKDICYYIEGNCIKDTLYSPQGLGCIPGFKSCVITEGSKLLCCEYYHMIDTKHWKVWQYYISKSKLVFEKEYSTYSSMNWKTRIRLNAGRINFLIEDEIVESYLISDEILTDLSELYRKFENRLGE